MNRREFLKWLAGATISTGTVYLGASKLFNHTNTKQTTPTEHKSAPEQTTTPTIRERGTHIAVLSDFHIHDAKGSITFARINEKALAAIDDMLTLGPDLCIVVGDVVQHGFPTEYTFAKKILDRMSSKHVPVYVTMGNHEFYNPRLTSAQAVNLFLQTFQKKTPYENFVNAGIHHILLSPEYLAGKGHSHDWARLSQAQMDWFANVLQQHRNLPTFVYLHQPLNNTVEQSQYVDWIARTAQTDELFAIIKNNPQIKCWFSGHTHAPLQHVNQVVYRNGVWFFGGASTFYTNDLTPRNGNPSGPYLGKKFKSRFDTKANQNRFVSIYHDRIVIQARDHVTRQWMKELEYTIPKH